MSDAAASPPQRDRGPRRGALHGRLLVNEYVGQSAADAAQAIRRAGLRPGLERSLGCEPDAIGHVLAQEPRAGSELARNAVVTLYVGAPGALPAGNRPDERSTRDIDQPQQPAPDETPPADAPQVPPTGRRRRKPRPPMRAPAAVASDAGPTEEWIASADIPPSQPPHHEEPYREGLDDPVDDGLPQYELVTHADGVLGGRAGSPWRRPYPTRRRLRREPEAAMSCVNPHHRRSSQ